VTLDVRHADDAVRLSACQRILAGAHGLAEGREVRLQVLPLSEDAAVPCSPRLVELISKAVEGAGQPVALMPSGAGHDGVAISALTGIGMLFVRCAGGISHNPAESVSAEDVAVAIDVTSGFLELLASRT
jgi:acetylornithine deacetylase/succinyl-diaminopimelate desuccinylase-like protein